jgi:hypothetical protein
VDKIAVISHDDYVIMPFPELTELCTLCNFSTKLTNDDDYNPFEHREIEKPNR